MNVLIINGDKCLKRNVRSFAMAYDGIPPVRKMRAELAARGFAILDIQKRTHPRLHLWANCIYTKNLPLAWREYVKRAKFQWPRQGDTIKFQPFQHFSN